MSTYFSSTGINSDLYAPLVAAAQYAAYENSIARQVTTVFDMPENSGKIVQIPVWSAVSYTTPEEGAQATFGNTATTSQNITLSEIVVAHRVTDMLRDSAFNDVLAQLGDQSGRAIAEGMDVQVFNQFSNFDSDVGGSGNVVISTDTILKAAATLRAQKLTGPFVAVLHPAQAYNLKKQLTYVGSGYAPAATDAANRVFNAGYLGSIANVDIYESGLIHVNGSTGDAVGAVFSPMALAHSMRGGIRLETMRQAAFRATDLVLTAVSGATTIRSNFGVKVTADASYGTK
jgi:hypothetical protein